MLDHDIRSTPKQQLMLEPSGSELVPIVSTVKELIWDQSGSLYCNSIWCY